MIVAIILAAGESKRFKNKLFFKVYSHPLLFYTLTAFEKHGLINQIMVVAHKKNKNEVKKIVEKYGLSKIKCIVDGGKTRQESLKKAINFLEKQKIKLNRAKLDLAESDHAKSSRTDPSFVVIHNGANPLVQDQEIERVIKAAKKYGAAAVAQCLTDTIKIQEKGFVQKTLDREKLVRMQTPQAIRFDWLKKALKKAEKDGFTGTDDVSLIENIGKKVKIVEASETNIKVTYENDLAIIKEVLKKNGHLYLQPKTYFSNKLKLKIPNIRKSQYHIGIGEDSHAYETKKGLSLGGVFFKEYNKLKANSDGDVILHAIFNALSSAISCPSLGKTADDMCKKNIKKSEEYLKIILKEYSQKKCKVEYLSLSIIADKPKIDPLANRLKISLAKILNIEKTNIGITATSGEGLISYKKGMKCTAIILMKKKDDSD